MNPVIIKTDTQKSHHSFHLFIYVSRQLSDTSYTLLITMKHRHLSSIPIQSKFNEKWCRQIDSIIIQWHTHIELKYILLLNWQKKGEKIKFMGHLYMNDSNTAGTTKQQQITMVRNNTKVNVNLNCIIVFLFVNFDLQETRFSQDKIE